MLGKLLKYDLKHSFKFWWILALGYLIMSIFSGICGFVAYIDPAKAFDIEFEIPIMITTMAGLAYMFFYAISGLFVVGAYIIIFIRLYRNFFTDEGYLTFTLPVKRTTMLNSKIINGMLVVGATELVSAVGTIFWQVPQYVAHHLNGYFEEILLPEIAPKFDFIGIVQLIFVISELLVLNFFAIYIHNLFVYWCGTFAATVTRKARVITSVGIYYVVSNIIGFILQMLFCFGLASVFNWLDTFSETNAIWIVILLMLCMILLCWIVSVLLYVYEYWMLDKKLNMA